MKRYLIPSISKEPAWIIRKLVFIMLIAITTAGGTTVYNTPCKKIQTYNLMRSLFHSHYFYESAIIGETILLGYPDYFKNDWVTYFTALSLYKLGFEQEALTKLKTIKTEYPQSPANRYTALFLLAEYDQKFPEEYRDSNSTEFSFALHLLEKRSLSSKDITLLSGKKSRSFLNGKIRSSRCDSLRNELLSGKTIVASNEELPYLMTLISRGLNRTQKRKEYDIYFIAHVLIALNMVPSEKNVSPLPVDGDVKDYCHLYKNNRKLTKEIKDLYKTIYK